MSPWFQFRKGGRGGREPYLALAQRVFTSDSFIISQRRSCSICLSRVEKERGRLREIEGEGGGQLEL